MRISDIDNDTRFDQAMRDLHARAGNAVSPATMAQLHRRRISALDGQAPARRRSGWPLAASFASVLAIAIGVQSGVFERGDAQAPANAAPTVAVAPAAPAAHSSLDALEAANLTALDENPDFFVWLASSDANLLAME